jgi:AcrR family transcriptional regulator
MDEHGFERVAFDAEVAGAAEVETELGIAPERRQDRARDHGPLLEREPFILPDVPEEVPHGVPHHLRRERPISRRSDEERRRQTATGGDAVLVGTVAVLGHGGNVTDDEICILPVVSAGVATRVRYRDEVSLSEPRTDDIILDAAEDCFALVGVRGTTIEDIAAAAGVSRITVYRRIGNRDQVVLSVLLRIVDRYLSRLRPRLLAQPDLASAVVLLIRSTVSAARRDDLSLLFASEERGATGAPIPGAMPPLAERFGASIALAADRLPGELAPGVTPLDAGEWVLRVIVSLATTEPARERSSSESDRFVRRFVLPGLLAPPT